MNDPSSWQVQRVVTEAQQALASLRDEHGQIIDGDQELLDALAAEGVQIEDILTRLGRAALDAAASVATADARIDALKIRRERFARRETIMRATLLAAMQAVGLRQHRDVEFSASISAGKAKVIVTDADLLPNDLVAIELTRTPDKAAILKRLTAAPAADQPPEVIPGAVLSNPQPTLTIRTK